MKWHTEKRKISELKNWEDNPRTITNDEYNKLKDSIDNLGNFDPLVIDTDGTVLAGNQRLKIHKERGDKEVEVSVPERRLTDNEIKKIGILSNSHSGEWNMDKLAEEFENTLKDLEFEDLILETFEDKNKEINIDDWEDVGIITFKFPQTEYMKVLSLIANAVEKTESDSNEECLLKLLQEYE